MEYKCLNWDIRATISDEDMRNYSRAVAMNVHMRTPEYDYARDTTIEESTMIESIVYGALRAISAGADIQSAKDTAENIAISMFPPNVKEYIDAYQTIYLSIDRFVRMVEAQYLIHNANVGVFVKL